MKRNFLLEIGTEELPTAAVTELAQAGADIWEKILTEHRLHYTSLEIFSTPRRLAWRINGLDMHQPNQTITRKGPALTAAKDSAGNWTKAALGFAASCGVNIETLEHSETDKGVALIYRAEESGKPFAALLPSLFAELIKQLPIAKRMRWSDFEQSFVRPVNSIIALADNEILPLSFFGINASNHSFGHRVHHPEPVRIEHANDYESALKNAYVIVQTEQRKTLIKQAIQTAAQQVNGQALMPEALIAEVANLVEYPVAVLGNFDAEFLEIPQEVLITTLQDNQKTFAILDNNGKMLPHFIAIANLQSTTPEKVRLGNEKVIRPRFADAQFFWQQDSKHQLADYLPRLANVVYQAKLGTLADKVSRLCALAPKLAPLTGADTALVEQAAQLSKSDLQTEMVMEFPELQGVMGKYYARREGLPEAVAQALEAQYFPLGAGAKLPEGAEGTALALAEKLDTLIGGFAIGAKPTGSKDPYALRRMAIALIRLLVEKRLSVSLRALLQQAAQGFPPELQAESVIEAVQEYVLERLQGYYREQGHTAEHYLAVRAACDEDLLDFDNRIKALNRFLDTDAAESLLASAKRIRNILKKNGTENAAVAPQQLLEAAEQALWQSWQGIETSVESAYAAQDYTAALSALGQLATPLERFFAEVMVMSEDAALRKNRLALLTALQKAFDKLADLSVF